jgi:hypothetical protein
MAASSNDRQTPGSPGSRGSATLVYDEGRGELVLFGGMLLDSSGHGGELPGDLWAWNGERWRRLDPVDGVHPEGRALPHLVYDSHRRRIVMFGGRRPSAGGGVELPAGIWEWDGRRWYRSATDSAPMLHAGVSYDRARRRVVAYGGLGGSGILRGVRVWSGRRWEVADSMGPPVPTGHANPVATATLPSGEAVFVTMQSGLAADSVTLETWTWNGSSWTRGESGPALTNLQATAGAPDGSIMIFQTSGSPASAPLVHRRGPTGSWTTVLPDSGPVIRGYPAAGYDPGRGRFVLYTDRLWEWSGRAWEERQDSHQRPR